MKILPALTTSRQTLQSSAASQSPVTEQFLDLPAYEPSCPLCHSKGVISFLSREHVPILMNLLFSSRQEAIQLQRGTIDLMVCNTCGFVFNRAFTSSHMYTRQYDNTQAHAPTFEAYIDTVVTSLVTEHNIHHCHVLEVGCGNGLFLRKLVEAGEGIQGYGFDPSYTGPTMLLDGRLCFEQRYYDATCTNAVDVLICRHVLEHIPDPIAFLRTLRQALQHAPGARIFLETPTIEWILRNKVFWDIYYEHCSYFCKETLALACEQSGFHVERIEHVFGDQYLWCEATCSSEQEHAFVKGPGTIPDLAYEFQLHEHRLSRQWKRTLQMLAKSGGVALLGAAGKGVTLANLIDPDGLLLSCVGDLNPRKQGCYLPGTGHPIVSYESLKQYGVTSAVLMNSNYMNDTQALLQTHQINLNLIDLTPKDHQGSVIPLMKNYPEQENLAYVARMLEDARQAERTIVFTNGVFDLLHAGHIQFLHYAKSLGDILVVAVDNDQSAKRLKGPGRPIHDEHDRLLLIASLDIVDYALLFSGDTLSTLIHVLRPHIYVKGAEYAGQPSPAAAVLQEIGGTWVIAPPLRDTLHTSAIIEHILALAPSPQYKHTPHTQM